MRYLQHSFNPAEMNLHPKRKNGTLSTAALSLVLLLLTTPLSAAAEVHFPEPDPPVIEAPADFRIAGEEPRPALSGAPAIEWTWHKTADGLHPDGNEQQMLWLANRARTNPAREGVWLAELAGADPDVRQAVLFFGVNLEAMKEAFAALPPKPPAAFDARLWAAAKAHCDYLIGIDGQTHDGQFARIQEAGFKYTSAAGIVFSYAKNALYGHAAFNIDWGIGPNGMQDPPGHRLAIMGVSGNWTNAGYAVVPETNPATQVGPQVITGDFAAANTAYPDHYNRFLVGTVWEDTNANGLYDPGEGLGGVHVEPDRGTYFAVTGESGGWAIPILEPGVYRVTFSGGELDGSFACTVSVGATSALVDLEIYAGSCTNFSVSQGESGGGGGGGGGCFLGEAFASGRTTPAVAAAFMALFLAAALRVRAQRRSSAACSSSRRTSSSRSMCRFSSAMIDSRCRAVASSSTKEERIS